MRFAKLPGAKDGEPIWVDWVAVDAVTKGDSVVATEDGQMRHDIVLMVLRSRQEVEVRGNVEELAEAWMEAKVAYSEHIQLAAIAHELASANERESYG